MDPKIPVEGINNFVESREVIRLQINTDGRDVFQVLEGYKHFNVPVLEFVHMPAAATEEHLQ